MELKKEKKSNKLNFGLKVLAGGIIGLIFGFGVCGGFTANNKLVSTIETTLQQNCDCEIVKSDISAMGIQYSVDDGLSNSKASYILENCMFSTSIETEAIRLNDILKKDIENYHSLDLITFQFKNSNQIKTLKFKDGCLFETGNIY